MKWHRWIFIAGVLAMAACSSPTITQVPQPPEDDSDKKQDPNHPGFVMPVTLPGLPGSLAR